MYPWKIAWRGWAKRWGGGWARWPVLAGWATGSLFAIEPVTFTFAPPPSALAPLEREISADVITPSHRVLRLPAFPDGEQRFSVRARADEKGEYRLAAITEVVDGSASNLAAPIIGPRVVNIHKTVTLRPVGRTRRESPGRFVFPDGEPYFPIGANLAWAPHDGMEWYRQTFRRFAQAGLNWARVWMASWGALDLDWLPPEMGPSPPPGRISETVARNWDTLVAEAEREGVYLQVVLQHHGQYSTEVNPNWNGNPWNAANARGFLHRPAEFFTSPDAARLTREKYRMIVARWSYSPAVLAWELFNEVHWVDALRLDHNEAAVAKWHTEMAAYLRSIDAYGHLVTTSTENLSSPIYAAMDYRQPHCYATNMLAGVRRFDESPDRMERPIFYGEMGDDHLRVTAEQKAAGVEYGPIVWSSLMGQGSYPAQAWEGDKIVDQRRLGELGAIARFVAGTDWAKRKGLREFSAAIEGSAGAPLAIEAGVNWNKLTTPELTVPMDGRQSLVFGTVPRFLVGAPAGIAEGFPPRITLHVDYPKPATARVRFGDAGPHGAEVRVRLDGTIVGEHAWPAVATEKGNEPEARPAALDFPVARGTHTIAIENAGKDDWVDFETFDLGLKTSALAAVGRRSPDFVALWIWNRSGVFALGQPATAHGTLVIDDVPAGEWHVTWWDTFAGTPGESTVIRHKGGTLRLPTPRIARHAAVVLSR